MAESTTSSFKRPPCEKTLIVASKEMRLADLVALTGLSSCARDVRRLIRQGTIYVNGCRCGETYIDSGILITIRDGMLLRVGENLFRIQTFLVAGAGIMDFGYAPKPSNDSLRKLAFRYSDARTAWLDAKGRENHPPCTRCGNGPKWRKSYWCQPCIDYVTAQQRAAEAILADAPDWNPGDRGWR